MTDGGDGSDGIVSDKKRVSKEKTAFTEILIDHLIGPSPYLNHTCNFNYSYNYYVFNLNKISYLFVFKDKKKLRNTITKFTKWANKKRNKQLVF